jgi:hypothetical protein
MTTVATSIRMLKLEELLVVLRGCKRKKDPHPGDINMRIVTNAIFPSKFLELLNM